MPRTLVLIACLLGLTAPALSYPRPDLSAELPAFRQQPEVSEQALRVLRAIQEDPPPRSLVRHSHYVVSNEPDQYLFHGDLRLQGGTYIGVGSDQNYLLAAWARPDLIVLMDFDQVVTDVHRAYRAFFLRAKTPADFMALWSSREREAEGALRAEYAEPTLSRVLRAYKSAREVVPRRLRSVLESCRRHRVPTYLDSAEQYEYLASMYRAGRVIVVRGDLTAGGALSSVAAAAKSLGAPVTCLYLSNAERYFKYTQGFRSSIAALPTAPGALALRTRARADGSYEYITQDLIQFQVWVQNPKIHTSVQFVRWRLPVRGTPNYYILREGVQP